MAEKKHPIDHSACRFVSVEWETWRPKSKITVEIWNYIWFVL